MILKVIALTEVLHSKQVVHTNLNPQEIFLRNNDINQMCFPNLYHASWDTIEVFKKNLLNVKETLTKIDIRTRNGSYLSPEYLAVGETVRNLLARHEPPELLNHEIQQLLKKNASVVTEQCDIFSIGVILYRLLLGTTPDASLPA